MDGLCFIAGCGPTIRLGDETVAVRALRLRDYALIEAEVLRLRGNPFDLLRTAAQHEALSKVDSDEVLHTLFCEVEQRWCRVSERDVRAWLQTWPGRIFGLWLAVRENSSRSCTLERIQKLAATLDWRAITEAIQLASSEDERGMVHWLEMESIQQDAPTPWSSIYRRLSSHPYRMTPNEISELTMTQLQLLLSVDDPGALRLQFESVEEFEAWQRGKAQRTERSVANLRRGLRWDTWAAGTELTEMT